ncbi:uncharacterized protein F4817DRAFT_314066 [Daldinia loculata]|uniref:uncharacterized protein n=1 Tax=Daldinia loculata TaxID=103429 RepID=UPI0020C1F036|nr:uncharacterized protein F4817DRAFT_314066 [Daldinia loculata]KAI1649128.1 hypothetical protein F4817DRAFT_314066 [Daldinia loculata]
MNVPPDHRVSQPGLEIVYPTDPEVIYPPREAYPAFVSDPGIIPFKGDAIPYNQPQVYGAYSSKELAPQPPVRRENGERRKLYLLIGGLVVLAVIVGAVVGGVLGSKATSSKATSSHASDVSSEPASSSSSSPSPTSTPSSSTSQSVNTTAIRPKTRLTVTGRRIQGNGFTSRLFWQGGDNKIRTSRYSSSSSQWSTPLVFNDIDAKPGTPIAVTIYLQFTQFEFFYLDPSSTFQGTNFFEDETEPKVDSINLVRTPFTVPNGSRMTAYWPYVIYQNTNTSFHRLVYDGHGIGWFNDTVQGWDHPDDIPLGDANSGIAVVPMMSSFHTPYTAGLAYRDPTGRLAIFPFGGFDTGVAWYFGTPGVTIPSGTSIAAFAIGRLNSNTTNTWILYQDASNKIQSVWQGDDNEWQGPQEVGDADVGTDIACLTEQVGDQPSQTVLASQTDMRRCYYQYKGLIREKRLASSSWVDGAAIPIE